MSSGLSRDAGTRLPFTKMQAVGNDFVVLEEAAWPVDSDWAQVAIRLCDRKFGIGGDGLLVVCSSEVADIRMRMFNPDGTEDMCGNGLRCVVQWAHERGIFSDTQEAASWRVIKGEKIPATESLHGTVETLVGVRAVQVAIGPESAGEIETDMGEPLFAPAQLPMLLEGRESVIGYPLYVEGFGEIPISVVNTGSTHTVLWVDELPDDDRFFALSPRIENHLLFPERTSVLWAANESSSRGDRIRVRIWERGVGETLGCGTGACAVAVLAAWQQKTKPLTWPVSPQSQTHLTEIVSRGGVLTVLYSANHRWAHEIEKRDAIVLIGTALSVYTGDVPAVG